MNGIQRNFLFIYNTEMGKNKIEVNVHIYLFNEYTEFYNSRK